MADDYIDVRFMVTKETKDRMESEEFADTYLRQNFVPTEDIQYHGLTPKRETYNE